MIIPNDCEKGHDRCGTRDSVLQFDDFVAREARIEASPAFGTDGLIAVVWEGGADPSRDPLHVGAVFVGPQVTPAVVGQRQRVESLRERRPLAGESPFMARCFAPPCGPGGWHRAWGSCTVA